MNNIRNLLFVSVFFISFGIRAQNSQAEYLEAKRLYALGDFRSSTIAFQELAFDKVFGAYARFYQALSLHKTDENNRALIVLNELLQYYPNWENNHEVLYWLSRISFENQENENGLKYLTEYERRTTSSAVTDTFIQKYLSGDSVSMLRSHYERFPNNKALANILASKINDQPFDTRDNDFLAEIIKKHNIDPQVVFNEELQNIFKSRYSIAVVLPFMFDSIGNPGNVLRNPLITDFFQGMLLAGSDLEADSIFLDFLPFDTKRDEETTRKQLDEIGKADVIVGPLLPNQISQVKPISFEKRVNMINPLSSNEEYLIDNPYAFLFRASYGTMAVELAKYVVSTDTTSTAAIYFGKNPRDSLFAERYREILETGGKLVVDHRSLDELGAKALLDTLTDQYERLMTKEEADSLLSLELEGRFIKFRKMRIDEEEKLDENEKLQSLWFPQEDEEGNVIDEEDPVKMLAYEMLFRVPKDSIGSFMIATRSNTIANNLISAVAAREDSAVVYSYGDWFDFKVINYELMERLRVTMAMPEYLNKNSYRFEELTRRFRETYAANPSDYHFHGYEFTSFLGTVLKDYGKYFQNGFYAGKTPGYLSLGVDFKGSNNNQIVPIVRMENYRRQPVIIPSNEP